MQDFLVFFTNAYGTVEPLALSVVDCLCMIVQVFSSTKDSLKIRMVPRPLVSTAVSRSLDGR